MSPATPDAEQIGIAALALMEDALAFLDQMNAPAHIGAHLDQAICLLRDHIGNPPRGQTGLTASPER